MRHASTALLEQVITNPRVAGVIGSTTAATSTFDYIQGGVSVIALSAGALLSMILIAIHILRWRSDKRESDMRYKILKLEKDVLEKEKGEKSQWPYRQE